MLREQHEKKKSSHSAQNDVAIFPTECTIPLQHDRANFNLLYDWGVMQTTRIQLAVAAVCCLLAFPAASAFGQSTNDDQVIEQARKSYYNLHDAGLKGFRCDVRVDWDAALRAMKTDEAAREQLLPLLRQMHFEVAMGPGGAPEISRRFDGTPPDEQAMQRLRAATGRFEQMLGEFFQEWSMFAFGPPLPSTTQNYRLEQAGDDLHITVRSDPVVFETLNKDYAIEEVAFAEQHSTATMRPQFKRGEKGYIPTVLDSNIAAAGADEIKNHVEIAYQNMEGFSLPQTVSVQSTQPAGDVRVQFSFENYQITK